MWTALCTARPPLATRGARASCRRRARGVRAHASTSGVGDVRADVGGDKPPPPPPDDYYSSGDESPGEESGNVADVAAMLAAAGRNVGSLPPDLQSAACSGRLTPALLQRYLEMEAHWFFRFFLPLQGFRERLMADPSFFVKVGIECGIGIFTKCAAEKGKREGNFMKELDFVTANVIMAIIADFMLVWLPAPTVSFKASSVGSQSNAVQRFFSHCPDNAFQKVPAGFEPWTLTQRLGAPLRNGAKLLAVGFTASMMGVIITNSLIAIRKQLDPTFETNKAQNPLVMSAAYASYMASSSNLRYQVVAGVLEERGIETIFAGRGGLCHALSLLLRTANTYLGSLMWVDYIRLLKLQPKAPSDD